MKRFVSVFLSIIFAASMAITIGSTFAEGDYIADVLYTLGEAASDPWEKAIYWSGAQDLVTNYTETTFNLRSFNPKLNTLPRYEESPEAWHRAFFANIAAYDLPLTLAIREGIVDAAAEKQIKKTVAAAKSSGSAFGKKAVLTALIDLVFPKEAEELEQIYGGLFPIDCTSGQLALLYATHKSYQLDVKGGPRELALTVQAPHSRDFLQECRAMVLDAFSERNCETQKREIEDAYKTAMDMLAARYSKKSGGSVTFRMDVDILAASGQCLTDENYFRNFTPGSVLSALIREINGPSQAEREAMRQLQEALNDAEEENLARLATHLADGRWTELDIQKWKIVRIMDAMMAPYINEKGKTHDIWELAMTAHQRGARDNPKNVPMDIPEAELRRRVSDAGAVASASYEAAAEDPEIASQARLMKEAITSAESVFNQAADMHINVHPSGEYLSFYHIYSPEGWEAYRKLTPELQEKTRVAPMLYAVIYLDQDRFYFEEYPKEYQRIKKEASDDFFWGIGITYRALEESGQAAVLRAAPPPKETGIDEIAEGLWTRDQARLFKFNMAREILNANYDLVGEQKAPGLAVYGADWWPLPYEETVNRFKDMAAVFAWEIREHEGAAYLSEEGYIADISMDHARGLVSAYFDATGKDSEEAGWNRAFTTADPMYYQGAEPYMRMNVESDIYGYVPEHLDTDIRDAMALNGIIARINDFFSDMVPPLERTDLPGGFQELADSLTSQAGAQVTRKMLKNQSGYGEKLVRLQNGEWTEREISHYFIIKLMDLLTENFIYDASGWRQSAVIMADGYTRYMETGEESERFGNAVFNTTYIEERFANRVEEALAILGDTYLAAAGDAEAGSVEAFLARHTFGEEEAVPDDVQTIPPENTKAYRNAGTEERHRMRMRYLCGAVNLINARYGRLYSRLVAAGTARMYRALEPPGKTRSKISQAEIWAGWVDECRTYGERLRQALTESVPSDSVVLQLEALNEAEAEVLIPGYADGKWTVLGIQQRVLVLLMDTLMEPYTDGNGNTYDIQELAEEAMAAGGLANPGAAPTAIPETEWQRRFSLNLSPWQEYLPEADLSPGMGSLADCLSRAWRTVNDWPMILYDTPEGPQLAPFGWPGDFPVDEMDPDYREWMKRGKLEYDKLTPEMRENLRIMNYYVSIYELHHYSWEFPHSHWCWGPDYKKMNMGAVYRQLVNSGVAEALRNAPPPELTWE